MEWLVTNLSSIYDILVQLIAVAAVVATLTPNTSDNVVVDTLLKFVNGLAFNFGKSSNDPKV